MQNIRKILPFSLVFLLGILSASTGFLVVLADGGNTNLIHGCVGTGVLNQGRLRIVNAGSACNANETALHWNKQGNPGYGGLMIDSLSNADLSGSDFRYRDLNGVNFSNSTIQSATLNHANLTNANLTGSNMSGVHGDTINFMNANLSGSIALGIDMTNSNFTGANLSSSDVGGSNFDLSNFTNANLEDATGFDDAGTSLSDVTWSNTTCPDGTNSDNNGNTCEGHLIP